MSHARKEAVETIVNERIRPIIALDGGRIDLISVNREQIAVRFGGTYLGHPCQSVVLKYVVEPILKDGVEGITSVVMVD